MPSVEELVARTSTFEEDLVVLDQTYDRTHELRNIAIDKLYGVLDRSNLEHVDITNGKTSEAISSFINSFNTLLSSQETAIKNRAKTKLDKKNSDNSAEYQEALRSMLTKFQDNTLTPSDLDTVAAIDQISQEHTSSVTDEELRQDPYDLT